MESSVTHRFPRILVDPSTFDLLNVGDLAMLDVAVARLRELWPQSSIRVFTDDPDRLRMHCPAAMPVRQNGRAEWISDRFLLGPLQRFVPHRVVDRLTQFRYTLMGRTTVAERRFTKLRLRLAGRGTAAFDAVTNVIDDADLFVVSGSAALSDAMPTHARVVLDTLARAIGAGVPTAMLSQGIGPLAHPRLIARCKEVLPRVGLIAVRERLRSVPILESLGVSRSRIRFTGDDAVELAFNHRPASIGTSLGINIRIAPYSGIGSDIVPVLRDTARQFAADRGIALVGLPIAVHEVATDHTHIGEIIGHYAVSDTGRLTPIQVIQKAGSCRVVLTGAYHAAVFSLAQGVPVICLANSTYVKDKFLGLVDQFGEGCAVVDAGNPGLGLQLKSSLERLWDRAESLRSHLLGVAQGQIDLGRAAYRQLDHMVSLGATKT